MGSCNKMEPFDDPDLLDDDLLIRRIDPENHLTTCHDTNSKKISTKAFCASSGLNGGMSVDIPKHMQAESVDPYEYVTTPKYVGSVVFSAGSARGVELVAAHDPIEDNPYHGQVWRQGSSTRFTTRQKRCLLEASSWFVPIPDVIL